MKKNFPFFTSYCILLFASVFTGVMILSWFQTRYLLNAPQSYLPGLKITMMITAGLTVMIAIAAFIVTRPFQKIISAFEETGILPTPEEIKIVILTYPRMNKVSIIGIIFGFAAGNGITVLVKYLVGVYDGTLLHVVLAMIQAFTYSGFVCVIVVYVTDFLMAKFRRELHIYSISNFRLGWSIARTIRVAVVICFLFIITNVQTIAFSIFNPLVSENGASYAQHIFYASILNLIPTIGIVFLMLTTLNKRIFTAQKQLEDLAEGRAKNLIDITNIDDFGSLSASANGLIEKQRELVRKIKDETLVINKVSETLEEVSAEAAKALQNVTDSYDQIAKENENQRGEINGTERDVSGLTKSAREVEKHVVEEASLMQQNAAAITEMTQNINSIASMTEKADEVSKGLSAICSESVFSLKNATEAIESIKEASNEIEKMVKAIQKITSQTNMLAMNAAIEAAHAGKYGAGFAVVADEVRTLAASSSQSTKTIYEKIDAMKTRVNAGVEAIELIENSFKKIEDSAKQNAEISASITEALHEQQIGAETNLESTRRAAEDTEKIKSLVTDQHAFTASVDSSMKTVVASSDAMKNAIEFGKVASDAMQEVVERINQTVRSNKTVVGELKTLMESYAGNE